MRCNSHEPQQPTVPKTKDDDVDECVALQHPTCILNDQERGASCQQEPLEHALEPPHLKTRVSVGRRASDFFLNKDPCLNINQS